MTTVSDRLELSRLIHRFGFGPRPGEYQRLLAEGIPRSRARVMAVRSFDPGLNAIAEPLISDLGPSPTDPTLRTAYWQAVWNQQQALIFHALDRMTLADYPLVERMTWFWHGHWATSVSKVGYALPMKVQYDQLRVHALGNFRDMAHSMVLNGALIYWLDGEVNVASAPNENLAREFMELFTLGVGNYSEGDVKAAAKGLTGYQVVQNNGTVTFDRTQHDYTKVSLLGETRALVASSFSDYVVSREATQAFIPRRLWFRFISTTLEAPASLTKKFASRDIAAVVHAMATNPVMRRPGLSQVKSPVEWFVSSCKALSIKPSTLPDPGDVTWLLSMLGQVPFNPPSVGGWPYDEAWLTAASTQYRFNLAGYLVQHGRLDPIKVAPSEMVHAAADWLGVAQWSHRTQRALSAATADPQRFTTLALCAPEFVVSV